MHESIAVTLIGPDRPGLIDAVATVAAHHGANWLESRMANLAGQFAGIVELQVPANGADALTEALLALRGDDLSISVAAASAAGGAAPRAEGTRELRLEITGHDHPGIVRDIAHALAVRGVGIESLETRLEDASWSGEKLFRADAVLHVPPAVAAGELEAAIEALSGEIMVDAVLAPVGAA